MAKLDERGSKLQQDIYNLACKAYKPYEVIYEYPIGALNQRIDIFVPLLGIALEIDGIQHFEFSKFFFKDENAWNNSVRLDTVKDKYLYEHGVKVVRIPYNTKIKTVEDLKECVNQVEYPPFDYEIIETESDYQKLRKEKFKEQQQAFKKKQRERQKALQQSQDTDYLDY